MDRYDFTSIMDRRGRDAYAFDGVGMNRWGAEPEAPEDGFDFIPMWVADMNFPTSPAVTRAIMERVQHPAFGYFFPTEEYYDAITAWRQGRILPASSQTDRPAAGCARSARDQAYVPHSRLKREHIGYENGVHGFITSAVRYLTRPGDSILLHSPSYVGFRSDTLRQGRSCVYSPLRLDDSGTWRMDLDDMARRIEENHIRVMIFCSPQNPSGKVWERSELEAMMQLLESYRVTVISDEIWADLVFPGFSHTPLQDVSPYAREHVLAAYAPSKTFNIAGLIGSYHIIYNDELREQVTREGSSTNYNEMNVLSMHALIGGYSPKGRDWLDCLMKTLQENARFAAEFIRNELPGVHTAMPQGTYMMWLDLKEYLATSGRTIDEVLRSGWRVGVGWQDGRLFEGQTNIRLNLASPKSRIEEAFGRMKKYVL